jgi:hypothetical protein
MRTVVAFGLLAGLGSTAHAHVFLMTPAPRNMQSLKNGPCGPAAGQPGSVRTTTVTEYRPGQTITVIFRDQFAHTGHYRIAFDTDGVDGFVDPVAENDFNNSPAVLKDAIIDEPGEKTYMVDVTLPNVECTNCTLQIIQVMTEAAGYNPANDVYYQCADIVLKADAPLPPPALDAGTTPPTAEADAGPEPTDPTPPTTADPKNDEYEVGEVTACAISVGNGGGTAALLVFLGGFALMLLSRRKR